MTLLQITAILSLLIAFGVDTPTVNHIHNLLIPPVASTTPIVPVPVIQTPVVQNAPVYFGSTAPVPVYVPPIVSSITTQSANVDNTSAQSVPTVQSKPMTQFQVLGAEIAYGVWLPQPVYLLRVFANLPISIASTTGMDGISIGIPLVENRMDGYAPYWSEAPLNGIPAQIFDIPDGKGGGVGGHAHNYQITVYSQDGQSVVRGVSVPY